MWNSLKCYARDLHFGRREKRGKEGERGRERGHFQFVIRRFPKKKRGKKEAKRSILFLPRHSGPLCSCRALRISFRRRRRRRQATKTYKSGQMKRETGREYRMDRRTDRDLQKRFPEPYSLRTTELLRDSCGRPRGPPRAGIPS